MAVRLATMYDQSEMDALHLDHADIIDELDGLIVRIRKLRRHQFEGFFCKLGDRG